ncbi:uncharacterized protein LOC121890054 [Scomber scombrus]|uniref:Uncharacterized protein LOC121890054 n=1 Tax=Scomber scombrus TaxID=13677 RepID=A0AAV1PM36_SCOSC
MMEINSIPQMWETTYVLRQNILYCEATTSDMTSPWSEEQLEGWISVSVCESQVVKVQPGEEVTLHCADKSRHDSLIFWFRLVKRNETSCISVMSSTAKTAAYCDGFQGGAFEMRSNNSTVFLKIKQVRISDSGLYFCGFYVRGRPIFSVIHLNVRGSDESDDEVDNKSQKDCDGVPTVILGGLTAVLVTIIISLTVTIMKLMTAATEGQNSQLNKKLDCDQLKDTALTLYSTTLRSRRPASEREVETHVIYCASR